MAKKEPEKKPSVKKTVASSSKKSITEDKKVSSDLKKTSKSVKPVKVVKKLEKPTKIKIKKSDLDKSTNSTTDKFEKSVFDETALFENEIERETVNFDIIYNKKKLQKAITQNLIPIEITPLKITLTKEPKIIKEREESQISLSINILSTIKKVWDFWTLSEHIKHWHLASQDWYIESVKNDFKIGGSFQICMMCHDNQECCDYEGQYTDIIDKTLISYTTKDNNSVLVSMAEAGGEVKVIVSFEPDDENTVVVQKMVWNNILENFKRYVECH